MELAALHYEINSMPRGTAKVDAIRSAIRLADQHGERQYCHIFRKMLLDDNRCNSSTLEQLVAISWIISDIDKHHEEMDQPLLFDYRHVAENLAEYPDISKDRVYAVIDDLHERLIAMGYSDASYHQARLWAATTMDDQGTAISAYDAYCKAAKDNLVFCNAYITSQRLNYMRYMGNYDEAVRLTSFYMRTRQKASCWRDDCNFCDGLELARGYNYFIGAALELGKYDEISALVPIAYKLSAKDSGWCDYIGYYMIYYARVDKATGLDIYKKHLSWSFLSRQSPVESFDFELGAAALLHAFADEYFTAKLPKEFSLYRANSKYSAAELAQYHYDKAKEIADALDQRNGTERYNNKLQYFVK